MTDFNPFPPVIRNPDRRYCSDKALWDVYKASLLLERKQERQRCLALVEETAKYYSTDIFREITQQETDLIHQEYPGLVDRISAAMGRACCRNIAEAIRARGH